MVRTNKVYIPNLSHRTTTKYIKGKMHGTGVGAVLLNRGGAGSASSYDSVDDYIATTGRVPTGAGLAKKLESLSLSVKPQKTNKIKNIKFNL